MLVGKSEGAGGPMKVFRVSLYNICISDLKLNMYTIATSSDKEIVGIPTPCHQPSTRVSKIEGEVQIQNDARSAVLPSGLLTEDVLAKDKVVRRQLTTVGDQSEDWWGISSGGSRQK